MMTFSDSIIPLRQSKYSGYQRFGTKYYRVSTERLYPDEHCTPVTVVLICRTMVRFCAGLDVGGKPTADTGARMGGGDTIAGACAGVMDRGGGMLTTGGGVLDRGGGVLRAAEGGGFVFLWGGGILLVAARHQSACGQEMCRQYKCAALCPPWRVM